MAEISLNSEAHTRRSALSLSHAQVDTLAIAAIAAALSLLHSGFVFGVENNLFHLPIVAGLYDEPQYQDDSFIQSLRYFASGVWVLLDSTERYFGNVALLFLGLDYVSRLVCFLGFLCCASLLGVVERRDKIIFALIACFTSLLDGDSYAGAGGLLIRYFTHSEIANGTVLLAIYFAAKARFIAATLALGATFFVNAFIAVWLAPLLALIAVVLLMKQGTSLAAVCSGVAFGAVLCIPLALPVLHAVLGNPEFGKPTAFDFVTYLHQYYGGHVLIDATPRSEIFALEGVALVGALALRQLGAQAAEIAAAYLGVALIYAAGVILPHLTGSPLLLNLHLLRSSTIVHLLAALALAALAVNWLRSKEPTTVLLASLIVALSVSRMTILLAIPIMLLPRAIPEARDGEPAYLRTMSYLVLASVVLIAWPYSTWQNLAFNATFADAVGEWMEVGHWARSSTPPTAIFLVPLRPRDDAVPAPSTADVALSRTGVFEYASHRRVYVDFKRGAATMWTSSYYEIWWSRFADTEQLSSLAERKAYASRNGIDYVIDLCQTAATSGEVLFRTKRLCVVPARS
ncbi:MULTISPECIES: DUF6798 domain-containing protein [unclassified Bradyrhizobium]|uniref:DUF6798 domain-containing protein n=1 Tax=unclassified Bradyrhizobium TaxID=2631580 RepID=UPI00247AEB1C|nr:MULTISPECIES: DUF6798 domain-containing protein [unclassified Bradyrhizobium]WGR71491.1 hypothetical protein MTX24_00535 [Bradyrhizobium sp. ISRA426]WGR76326.1 hypothetical protein MTX21_25485 [Bradyrhizobium sp. ISRA430]WGR86731.1 hypothetical protein MTX25_00535 [Bradyrhizobium sp. ISRA432]